MQNEQICTKFNEDLSGLQKILNYFFKDQQLLLEALTHSSFSHENNISYNYERLEFLGDAVLEFLISEHILSEHLDFDEGMMSRLRAYLVNESFLSTLVRESSICTYIKLGKGEASSGICSKDSILSDVFESLCAAIYLDGGYESAKAMFKRFLADSVTTAGKYKTFLDEKSELQEVSQKLYKKLPQYKIVSEAGPDHAKEFTIEVNVADQYLATGSGRSKGTAEKEAARNVLKAIKAQQQI